MVKNFKALAGMQMPAPQSLSQITPQTADREAHDARSAEIKTAALGVAQIRHAVANAGTLSLSRVTVSPTGAICYQFQPRNSRGVNSELERNLKPHSEL